MIPAEHLAVKRSKPTLHVKEAALFHQEKYFYRVGSHPAGLQLQLVFGHRISANNYDACVKEI